MIKPGDEAFSQLQDLLADHTMQIRELVEELRSLIYRTIPDASEAVYTGWHGLGYRHPACGYFCAIFPQKDRVNLGFEWGILLPDPDKLLGGTGKQLRYVYVESSRELKEDAIGKLLVEAVSLPNDRGIKLQMINDRRESAS